MPKHQAVQRMETAVDRMYAKKHPNTVMSKKAAMYAVLQNLNKIEYPKSRGSTFDTEVSPKNAIPSSTECMGGCPTNFTGGAFMSVSFMGGGGFLISLMQAGGFLRSKILLVGKLFVFKKLETASAADSHFQLGFLVQAPTVALVCALQAARLGILSPPCAQPTSYVYCPASALAQT